MTRDESELTIVRDVLASTPARQDRLLPLLHEIQHRLGYVPPSALPLIAQTLNLSRAEVHGVASFYHDIRDAPAGRHIIELCQAEACQAVGCRALLTHAQHRLGICVGETTSDGRITLQRTYCFGNCACGPTLRIGDRVVGRVDAAGFDALVSELEAS
jgi:formate dehydrogenase subunit gamma